LYSNERSQDRFRSHLEEAIFLAIELGKMNYADIMIMPIDRLRKYFKWKEKYDEEVAKQRKEYLDKKTDKK